MFGHHADPPSPDPVASGVIRTVWPLERARLAAHLRRLGPDDLRLRFHGMISDASIDAHVDDAFGPDRHVYGWFLNHDLRGAVELSPPAGDDIEAAITLERDWRGRGIARALLLRAMHRSAAAGARHLIVHTTRDNPAMVRLARAVGASIEGHGGDIDGSIDTPAPGPLRLLLDLAKDEAALAIAALRSRLTPGR
ncbi:MAG: GNAT superfamily N-acetyltransferase [Paracoccaceae bacterium]|jgi:GNAT superfamily N-acetyltransferase